MRLVKAQLIDLHANWCMVWVSPRPCTASSQAFSVNALRDKDVYERNDKRARLDHVTREAYATNHGQAEA